MKDSILKYLSILFNTSFCVGYRLSNDNTVKIPKKTIKKLNTNILARRVSRVTAKYKLSDTEEIFELVTSGFDSNNCMIYTFEHCRSGEKMILSKSLFNSLMIRL